jgi:hypothetical protein
MAFIKKHLVLLIAAVVSLGVLGYAVFFVQQKKATDAEVSASLDESAEQFRQLLQRKVHPGNEKVNNIEIAKQEVVKMRSFMDEMREYLKGPQIATNLNNQMFRAKLDTSMAELRREAEQAGVTLPNTNYWFAFSLYKTTVDFRTDAAGLASQLEDVRAMMRVIYDARVHSLVSLRRASVSDSDMFGSENIPSRQPRTNDWAVTTSYELTFQGFSSELARVMEGLANAKQCFVVKSVGVGKAPEERARTAPVPIYMPPPTGMERYGPRYGAQPQFRPMAPAAASTPRPQIPGMKTVLDENRLRFTLLVDSVRLKGK